MEKDIDENAAPSLETALITGGPKSGKTQQLVERAAKLASTDEEQGVLVFCASPLAARAFEERLARLAGGEIAHSVRVTTPQSFATNVLSTNIARAATGREPRILTSVEETFLMEDMKVSGVRPRRLREMLKFFYRSFTELADDAQGEWLDTAEEKQVHSLLKANLAFVQGYLKCEITAAAYRLLSDNAQLRAQFAASYVIADDYQLLSRASQKLICLVAARSLAVAGDAIAYASAYEPYPYAKGIAEFAEKYPQAKRTLPHGEQHPKALAEALARLAADPCMANATESEGGGLAASAESAADNDEGALEIVSANNPSDELRAVARLVADAIAEGVDPADIAVAAPNALWVKNACAALAAADVSCENPFAASSIARGDARKAERCASARILTLLDLVADPSNATAWRSWCGYGDYLVHSGAFSALRAFAEKRGLTLVEALKYADENRKNGERNLATQDESEFGAYARDMTAVLQAYRTAQSKIDEWRQSPAPLAGRALLDDVARFATNGRLEEAPSELARACLAESEPVDPNGHVEGAGERNSAQAMACRARKALTEPWRKTPDAVLVAPYDGVAGLSPRMLVVTGFVNGFIPDRDYFDATVTTIEKQEKMHARDMRRVYSLVGEPRERLVVTYFTSASLEQAERMKLKISRIRWENGNRICAIAPSDFLRTITEP